MISPPLPPLARRLLLAGNPASTFQHDLMAAAASSMDVPPAAITVHSLLVEPTKCSVELEVNLNLVPRITNSESLSRAMQV